MTEKEYNEIGGGIPLMNFADYREWSNHWFMARAKAEKRFMISADNRAAFKRIFGKPHFHFHGSHYFHCWDIVYNGLRIVILTAREHGTCYEQIGRMKDGPRVEFIEWVAKKLMEDAGERAS